MDHYNGIDDKDRGGPRDDDRPPPPSGGGSGLSVWVLDVFIFILKTLDFIKKYMWKIKDVFTYMPYSNILPLKWVYAHTHTHAQINWTSKDCTAIIMADELNI